MLSEHTGRRWRLIATLAAAMGLLHFAMPMNVFAVAYPGINGLLACGGTLPTGTPNVNNFEVYTIDPDTKERINLTSENPITDYNPLWTPDGSKILYETEFVGQQVDDTFELVLMNPDGSQKTPLVVNGRPEDIPKGLSPGRLADRLLQQPGRQLRDLQDERRRQRPDATHQQPGQ